MSLSDSLTLNAQPYARLEIGKFIDTGSSADEPRYLILKDQKNKDGTVQYLVRLERAINNPVVGAPDQIASMHLVIKGPASFWTPTTVEFQRVQLNDLLTAANVAKILRGEK